MPQNRETGARGAENGYRNADDIAALLQATRVSSIANEFTLAGRRVAIKTGERGIVIPDGLLARVNSVVYAYPESGGWTIYEVDAESVRRNSQPSRSASHQNGIYHALSKTKCRALGTKLR